MKDNRIWTKTPVTCAECAKHFEHGKQLSNHIKSVHELSSEEYVIKYMYDGIRPLCPICGSETRFRSLNKGYVKYCGDHAKHAMSVAGRVGGQAEAWNKGLSKETDDRVARLASKMCGSANPFYGKKHSTKTIEQITSAKKLSRAEIVKRIQHVTSDVTLLSSDSDYVNRQKTLLNIRCDTCLTEDNVSLFNIERAWRCRTCYPLASKPQLDVSTFVKELGFDVVICDKQTIAPLELDIYVPAKKLAIEYHGLYWHSGGREQILSTEFKKQHRRKYELARDKDIKLIQLFSDEWEEKRDICESMISNALGCSSVRINARECELINITPKESREFVDANHIAGSVNARLHIGLKHPTLGLVMVATLRTPVQKKWGSVSELARMCVTQGSSVRGGASRLIKHLVERSKELGYDGMLSYSELRYGEGHVYELCGFERKPDAIGNYWYTDGRQRFNRFKFRAQDGKTERQVASDAGVRSVWGCGNAVYIMNW